MFHLTIGLWMGHGCVLDLDAGVVTKIPKGLGGEIGTQVCDHGVRKTKSSIISEMKSEMKSTTLSNEILTISLYSIHLIDLSTANNMC